MMTPTYNPDSWWPEDPRNTIHPWFTMHASNIECPWHEPIVRYHHDIHVAHMRREKRRRRRGRYCFGG